MFHRESAGMSMKDDRGEDGLVLGIEISPFNQRSSDGSYRTIDPRTGAQSADYFLPNAGEVTLTLVPVSERGSLGGEKRRKFSVVNEFQSGLYQVDANRVLAPLGAVQAMLRLDSAPIVSTTEFGEDGRPTVIGESPRRATTIVVRAEPGVSALALRDAVKIAYQAFSSRLAKDPTRFTKPPLPDGVNIATWEERLADFIGPVEKERELMRTLFSIVYLVCAGLVLAIFWAIVQEKTRDIGILRAIGASRTGVLWIFLRYGLLIGIAGSLLGVLIAWAVVARINDIHGMLGSPAPLWLKVGSWLAVAGALAMAVRGVRRASALHTVLWSFLSIALSLISVVLLLHHGFLVWDASVYYFSRIPSSLDLFTAATTALGGVIFSVVGASIPAARAADTDPVKSLRYD